MMNQRIEELSLQCIRYKLVAEGARSDFDYKKFAELIVRECAALIPAEQSHAPNGQPMAKIFEEHFGVKL